MKKYIQTLLMLMLGMFGIGIYAATAADSPKPKTDSSLAAGNLIPPPLLAPQRLLATDITIQDGLKANMFAYVGQTEDEMFTAINTDGTKWRHATPQEMKAFATAAADNLKEAIGKYESQLSASTGEHDFMTVVAVYNSTDEPANAKVALAALNNTDAPAKTPGS